MKRLTEELPGVPYVAPFAAFIILLGVKNSLDINANWEYPVRVVIVCVILWLVSRAVIPKRPARLLSSVVVGIFVFLIWIAPDWIWPLYRSHWLFENAVVGAAKTSLPSNVRASLGFLVFRLFGTAILVPVIEELFWRGWLMRYLINVDFRKVPLGTYSATSVWLTAVLFATEHGPYWDVGLCAGLIYNAWMLRTRSLADCMIAHAVTNACLAIYVIAGGHWEYWL